MKKLVFIISSLVLIVSCAVSHETSTEKISRETRARLDEAVVKKAVESRRYIVRFDRMYTQFGGMVELRPRSNYLIIDRNNAVINTAYIGRQYGAMPIAGINVKGRAASYKVVKKMKNGSYEIVMRVDNGSGAFDVYLTIGRSGLTTASVNSMRINGARYRGQVVPIGNRAFVEEGSEII
jgi:hypothetical protein